MHFIFVACNKNKKAYRNDPSFIYRCENLAYGLEKLGHTIEITHMLSFIWNKKADVVIFHRPSYSKKLFITVSYLKFISAIPVFDVDDLIFNPRYTDDSPAVRNKILPFKKVEKQFQNNLKALRLFSHFSVSTTPLAEHIRQLIPNSRIVELPNAVHYSWKNHQNKTTYTETKKLAYLPGTKSHDKDFASIAKGLSRFLKNHPEIKLYITGPLEFDLDVHPSQVVYNEKVPFSQHWRNYKNVWVNLAPLERTAFTECKSALKIIEAAYWGIPTVCMPTSDAKHFVNRGAIIVENEKELISKLEELCDSKVYSEVTKNMQNNLAKFADVEKSAQIFLNYIEKQFISKKKNSYLNYLFSIKIAKNRRKKGLYNCETLWYYKKGWQKKKTPEAFVEYCMFRRDLGFPLSENRVKILINFLDKLANKSKKAALSLLKEVASEDIVHIYDIKENRKYLKHIHENQQIWRNSFKEELYKSKKNGICVVGNSSKLLNSMLGDKIDQHGLVVRFNRCWNKDTGNQDIGKQLDIWVSAPDNRVQIQSSAHWIVISGPDMLYREAGWDRFEDIVNSGGRILTIPLEIWRKLVCKLQAPPSAGILILLWFREIFGAWDGICATGFDFSAPTDVYHHADSKYLPSNRHNWSKEKRLLWQWKNEGLEFLG